MAAGNFDASASLRILSRLSSGFADNVITNPEVNERAESARVILFHQTANVDPVLTGDRCTGVKVYFWKNSSDAMVDEPTDCGVPCGDLAETGSEDWDSEIIARSGMSAIQNRCNNQVTFEEESARAISVAMNKARKSFNEYVIGKVIARAQTNIDTTIDPSWDDTTHAPKIDVPKAQFTWDNIGEFIQAANGNRFGSFIFLSGRNFFKDHYVAQYSKFSACCDAGAAVAYMDGNIFFDPRDLDVISGDRSTYCIDRNSYCFWNTYDPKLSVTPQQVDTNHWVQLIPDPILSYNKNGVTVPLMWKLEAKRQCTGRDALENLQFTWCYYVSLAGGFKFAPSGTYNGGTVKGVLRFASV